MDLISLQEAKAFLNIQGSSSDFEIEDVVDAMTRVVEREVGPIVNRTVTSVVTTHDGCAVLPLKNIVAIKSVTVIRDGSSISTDGLTTHHSILAYANGERLPRGDLSVEYEVGLADIPSNIKYGALEVLKLAWAAQNKGDLPAFLLSYRASAWFLPDQELPGFA